MSKRVLQIGFGNIGSEVFEDYRHTLVAEGHTYMVTDLVKEIPQGYEWDEEPVDLAIVMVDTRPTRYGDGFDYRDVETVLSQYADLAAFFLVRSTVSRGFFDLPTYQAMRNRIGLSPEFNGATPFANRRDTPLGFEMFTYNVPQWFVDATTRGKAVFGNPREVALAKLAENAFLALKVTFFHELILGANARGIEGEEVRRLVTTDPRIGEANSFMPQPGWTSHCYDKDVPAYARLTDSKIVERAIRINANRLLPLREQDDPNTRP